MKKVTKIDKIQPAKMPRINCVLQLTAEFQRRLMHNLKAWKHKRAIMKTTSIHEMIGALRVCTTMRA